MPPRPIRRRQLVKYQPLTFSSFSRSVAHIASISMTKQQRHDSKSSKKQAPPKSAGKELMNSNREAGKVQSVSSDEEEFDEVQADFAFFDPKPDDFHGVKTLLQFYLDDKIWDLSGFVDLILGQTTVGTVVKVEGDEDNTIYSVVTALNLHRYKDHKCIMEVKEFLLGVCKEKDVKDNLKSLLGEKANDVGLLVSQRYWNLAFELLPPLYDGLFDEVSWATEDEPTEKLRKSFCFKYYVIVTKVYKGKNVDQKKRKRNDSYKETEYAKIEDEIFHKLSLWSFLFPLQTQQVAPPELGKNYRPMGLVMAVKADKIPTFRQELTSLINNSEAS
ncbi:hypothetical protein UlMin_040610 [Ulmus minor]